MFDRGESRGQSWDAGALVLRVVLGVTMALHGSQKLFGAFGGPGPAGWEGMIAQMGLPVPALFAWLAILAEFAGGILLVLGVLSRLAALGILIDMAVAIWKVHGPRGFFIPGCEYNVLIIAVCLALILTGPGRLALWSPWRRG